MIETAASKARRAKRKSPNCPRRKAALPRRLAFEKQLVNEYALWFGDITFHLTRLRSQALAVVVDLPDLVFYLLEHLRRL